MTRPEGVSAFISSQLTRFTAGVGQRPLKSGHRISSKTLRVRRANIRESSDPCDTSLIFVPVLQEVEPKRNQKHDYWQYDNRNKPFTKARSLRLLDDRPVGSSFNLNVAIDIPSIH